MHDEPIRRHPAEEQDQAEHAVLMLLLLSHPPGPWSVREIGQMLGDELAAEDAVVNLHATGLVHRIHEFAFPTRAAVRLSELQEVA